MARKPTVSMDFDFSDVVGLMDAMHDEYRPAAARVLNRAAGSKRGPIARDVASAVGVKPLRLIRRRMKIDRAKKTRLVAALRVLAHPVPASLLQGVRDTRRNKRGRGSGVRASGGHHWPRAFLARGIGASEMVFERKGSERHPLKVHKIEIRGAVERAMRRHAADAGQDIAEKLPREIMFRVSRRARRVRVRTRGTR